MTDTASAQAPISRGEKRRRAVLEAAIELFLENGYAATSLDMVIAKAGGSRRTLYEHFGNKEGLFAASIEHVMNGMLSTLGSLDFNSDDPEHQLSDVGYRFLATMTAPRTRALFRILLAELNRFPELGCMLFERGPEQAYRQIADYLRIQTAQGRLRIGEPEWAARHFIEMVKGELHLRALMCPERLPDDAGLQAHVQQTVRYFLKTTGNAG